jgi:TPR repeat protein
MFHNYIKTLFLIAGLVAAIGVHADALEDGHTAFDAKHYKQAYTLWKPLAEHGNADAQYNLGLLYMNGLGVEKNDRMALKWFIRAGQQGLADAQYNAGVMFYLGKGVYPSYITAVKWWQLAANKDHANAENNLAVMYAYGYGVKKEPARAIKLWTAAAKQGHPDAINALIEVYSGKMAGFKADLTQARYWQHKKTAR